MVNKLALSILISIILTVILVSTVNVGVSLFLNEPEYSDYCGSIREAKLNPNEITQESCEAENGTWTPEDIQCVTAPCPQGFCNYHQGCSEKYEEASKPFNQYKFYIFAGLGFLLLLVGLFAVENLIQITGLATGGILVFEGIVTNLQDKLIVFISLILILAVFGVLGWRIVNKKN
jgi:hypothetical protein